MTDGVSNEKNAHHREFTPTGAVAEPQSVSRESGRARLCSCPAWEPRGALSMVVHDGWWVDGWLVGKKVLGKWLVKWLVDG